MKGKEEGVEILFLVAVSLVMVMVIIFYWIQMIMSMIINVVSITFND